MKTKTLLSIFAFSIMISAFGQKPTIELTFTAENSGQYIHLDSILIENLTQGGDTTLYAPDTILVIDYVASIGENGNSDENTFSVSQNYPNPFMGKTKFNLYLPEKGNIQITGRDIIGRELVHYENILNRGNHSFAFYAGNESYYLLTVTGNQTSQTIKMLNAGSTITNGEKCKIVYTGNKGNVSGFKSQQAINNFGFTLGDELKYTAYSYFGESSIISSPSNNQNYTFLFELNIPCPTIPTVTYEGKTYNTVLIGNQCWLKENLSVGGNTSGYLEQWDNNHIERYCYDNNWEHCGIYGGFYQWDEMMQYTTTPGVIQGICPPDWHIPTDEEWKELEGIVDSQFNYPNSEWDSMNYFRGFDAGLNIKLDYGWTGGGNGTDLYGFEAMWVGFRNAVIGNFVGKLDLAYFWTSSEHDDNQAIGRKLQYNADGIYRANFNKGHGYSVRCIHNEPNIATVTTGNIEYITAISADVEGEITNLWELNITQHGHCWSIEPNPTIIDDYKTELGTSTILYSFTSNLTGLDPETIYYVRAYATNSMGTSYGAEKVFETFPEGGMGSPCPDLATLNYAGQIYNTILIENQCWLKENLNVGIMINGSENQSNNSTIEKYCFDDDSINCETFGALYQWNEIMQYTTDTITQGICPIGWHIPTDFDWKVLEGSIDSLYGVGDPIWEEVGWRGFDVSTKLRQGGSSGFEALYAGNLSNGWFGHLLTQGTFWTSSKYDDDFVFIRGIFVSHPTTVYRASYNHNYPFGHSVRCLKD